MTPVRQSVSSARMKGVNKLMRARFHEELHASYDFDLDAKFPMMGNGGLPPMVDQMLERIQCLH